MKQATMKHFIHKYHVLSTTSKVPRLEAGDTFTISFRNPDFPISNVTGVVMQEEDIERLMHDIELLDVSEDPEAVKTALEQFLTLKALSKKTIKETTNAS